MWEVEFGMHFTKEWTCPSFAAILVFMFKKNFWTLLSYRVVFVPSLRLGVSLSDVCYPLISKLACTKKNQRKKKPQIPLNDSLGQPDWAEFRYTGSSHSIMTSSPKLLPCFLWAGPSPSLTVDTMERAASCLVIKPIPAPLPKYQTEAE